MFLVKKAIFSRLETMASRGFESAKLGMKAGENFWLPVSIRFGKLFVLAIGAIVWERGAIPYLTDTTSLSLAASRPRNRNSYLPSRNSSSVNHSQLMKSRITPKITFSYFTFQVFVLLLSILVTLQQALSSGYLNSVITTIEKRYEIPSSISGIIASMYEIGNVITVIFVSYLGSRRHIPVWIGMGKSIFLARFSPSHAFWTYEF